MVAMAQSARSERTNRMAGKARITNSFLLGRSEVLRTPSRYLQTRSQGQHTIDRLEERRERHSLQVAVDDYLERRKENDIFNWIYVGTVTIKGNSRYFLFLCMKRTQLINLFNISTENANN